MQNVNQEVARVVTGAMRRLFVGQLGAQTPHRGVATGSRKQSLAQRNARRKIPILPLSAPKDLCGDFECSESTVLGCATDIKPKEQRR